MEQVIGLCDVSVSYIPNSNGSMVITCRNDGQSFPCNPPNCSPIDDEDDWEDVVDVFVPHWERTHWQIVLTINLIELMKMLNCYFIYILNN